MSIIANTKGESGHGFGYGISVSCPGQFECIHCGIDSMETRYSNELVGKLLTIIDGSIIEERQNKAVKDQIRDAVYPSVRNLSDDISQAVMNTFQAKK